MVYIEAVAWPLLVAEAGKRAIERIAQPVHHDRRNRHRQSPLRPARQRETGAGGELCAEAQQREVVAIDACRGAFRQPAQGAAFHGRRKALLDPCGIGEGSAPVKNRMLNCHYSSFVRRGPTAGRCNLQKCSSLGVALRSRDRRMPFGHQLCNCFAGVGHG